MVTVLLRKTQITMGTSNHFSGQPLYSQVIKLLNKAKILCFSREHGGERYTKRFNCSIHLKPAFQGRRTTSQDRQKERWYQGAHSNPGQRGRSYSNNFFNELLHSSLFSTPYQLVDNNRGGCRMASPSHASMARVYGVASIKPWLALSSMCL